MTDPGKPTVPAAPDPAAAPAPPPAPATVPAATMPAATAPAAPSAVNTFMASMTQAEMMVGSGALIILLADLIFGIFGEYSFSSVIWGSAAVAVLVIALRRLFNRGFGTAYETVLVLATALVVLATVRNLLLDILFIPGRNLDVTYFLGALALYAGVVLMAIGAWRMLRTQR